MTLSILPAGAIAAGVHHTFNDSTLADVTSTMGTMDEAAAAEFDLQMGYAHSNGQITKVDLTMTLTIDMPVWSKAGTYKQVEQDECNRRLGADAEKRYAQCVTSTKRYGQLPFTFRRFPGDIR